MEKRTPMPLRTPIKVEEAMNQVVEAAVQQCLIVLRSPAFATNFPVI